MLNAQLLNAILSGKCTLFTGAGFSLGAKNIKNEILPLASNLAGILYAACDMESDGDLTMAAEAYKQKYNDDGLIKKLRDTFYISTPTEEQAYITSMSWRSIYTVNYDNVLEVCLSNAGMPPINTGINSSPNQFPGRNKLIVHLNGNVEDLQEGAPVPDTFKLTDVSYATDNFLHSAWHSQLQQDLMSSQYTIFIGCSLKSDLDLKRILRPLDQGGKKAIFVIREGENPTTITNLKYYGEVYSIGLAKFVQYLKERKALFIPSDNTEPSFFSFHKYKLPVVGKFATSDDAFHLLFGGKVEPSVFFHSITQPTSNPYYFPRMMVKRMFETIKADNKNILVISDTGNGKSIAIEALAYHLLQDDFQVFKYEKSFDTLNQEIELINRMPRPVIILESYTQHRKVLENIQLHRSNRNLVLIATERTAVYETSMQTLVVATSNAEFSIFDVNELDESDVNVFSKILDAHGLWGNDSALSEPEKQILIKRECHSTTREVLLRILKSENIIGKFSAIREALDEKKHYFKAVVLMLTANQFNISIDLQYVSQVLNTLNILESKFTQNLAIRELLDIEKGTVKIRSSIVSEVLLTQVSHEKDVIDAILGICNTIDEWEDETSQLLMREYVNYANLKWLLSRTGRDEGELIYHFFDQTRNLKSYRKNHHYWLQRAILDIERGNFPLAQQHLETAYEYAKEIRWNYNTYQIDNQMANLLLKELIEGPEVENSLKKFKQAHEILTRSTDPNRLRHYPYKVAEQYIPFYNRYFRKLSMPERQSLIHCFNEMIGKMEEYAEHSISYRARSSVKRTREQLSQLVASSEF